MRTLADSPLDPTFEEYGSFVIPLDDPAHLLPGVPTAPAGTVMVWGNFYELSAVFRIEGPREQLADVIEAIRANQATPAYVQARTEIAARKVQASAEQRALEALSGWESARSELGW